MDLEQAVFYCLEDILGYRPELSDRLVKDLDLDSLSSVSLLLCLSEEFNIEFTQKDLDKFMNIIRTKTVYDLIKGLQNYVIASKSTSTL